MEEYISDIKEIIRTELPSAIAKVIVEKQQQIPQWVDIRKASQALDCSPKLFCCRKNFSPVITING